LSKEIGIDKEETNHFLEKREFFVVVRNIRATSGKRWERVCEDIVLCKVGAFGRC
jgi:hypothetical protein